MQKIGFLGQYVYTVLICRRVIRFVPPPNFLNIPLFFFNLELIKISQN